MNYNPIQCTIHDLHHVFASESTLDQTCNVPVTQFCIVCNNLRHDICVFHSKVPVNASFVISETRMLFTGIRATVKIHTVGTVSTDCSQMKVQMRAHYDSIAAAAKSRARDYQDKQLPAVTAPMRRFHNHVKRSLILAFAKNADSLLDLCCGRGGDLHKWAAANIRYVKGLDFSHNELTEARGRYDSMSAGDHNHLQVDFVQVDDLGRQTFVDVSHPPYDVVSCMFALQYFFDTPQSLRTMLTNVSVNLRPGGYFIGTVPFEKGIRDLVRGGHAYDSDILSINIENDQSVTGPYGRSCVMRIRDTVTDSTDCSYGSHEFLVDEQELISVAAEYGLKPVTVYCTDQAILKQPVHNGVFRQFDGSKWYCGLSDHFQDTGMLRALSSLFCTFVFVKDSTALWD